MSTKTMLVTGANGQLGKEFQTIANGYAQFQFLFVTKEDLSIVDTKAVEQYFTDNKIDVCINCAAYTAVDKAETEKDIAFQVNGDAPGTLAAACKQHNAQFIHISTDYVFDGTATTPYKEDHPVKPVNAYGASKLAGEESALKNNPESMIIRTSWVYSSFGNNFVKTMLRLMKERDSIGVINDQQGCPTYAKDLAQAIMSIVLSDKKNDSSTIFNYSNHGVISWFEFATAIKELSGSSCVVNPIVTAQYPTPAKRPAYSVMDTSKIQSTYNIAIPQWKDSLKNCLDILLHDQKV